MVRSDIQTEKTRLGGRLQKRVLVIMRILHLSLARENAKVNRSAILSVSLSPQIGRCNANRNQLVSAIDLCYVPSAHLRHLDIA